MTNTTTPKEMMGLRSSLIESLVNETDVYPGHIATIVDNLLEAELFDLDALRARYAPVPAVEEEAITREPKVGDMVRVRKGAVGYDNRPADHKICVGMRSLLGHPDTEGDYSAGGHSGPLSDFELAE